MTQHSQMQANIGFCTVENVKSGSYITFAAQQNRATVFAGRLLAGSNDKPHLLRAP